MTEEIAIKVDSKGRVTIPKELRDKTDINCGDILFVDANNHQLKFTKAVKHPGVVLKEYALKERDEGKATNLRDL
ncbi:AbrB/MazE/SpoVT family DNA-binding domain-containing protein [Fuchsiella alkaliacetigena]|uniref:AbrB/MazE/SpoVT family DNA-binding domain-containing protein n=1 Tax=Fuchsiella alkaliacetigena TaxID=957042 RepID=UPI00200B01A0|nr:AbrB/MazE/SpoVT family DNA-binding domain-containing protein [Fuchsiella alkaliacetigena]MCK8825883.1 AbrB/MazE/SpoVT family DNA-binding domain-containing protein [Fuchsiella alkaliacetigena]